MTVVDIPATVVHLIRLKFVQILYFICSYNYKFVENSRYFITVLTATFEVDSRTC